MLSTTPDAEVAHVSPARLVMPPDALPFGAVHALPLPAGFSACWAPRALGDGNPAYIGGLVLAATAQTPAEPPSPAGPATGHGVVVRRPRTAARSGRGRRRRLGNL